jgi:hypothetical protein
LIVEFFSLEVFLKFLIEFLIKEPGSGYLTYASDQSLMVFDKNSIDTYKASDYKGRSGYVKEENLNFYSGNCFF